VVVVLIGLNEKLVMVTVCVFAPALVNAEMPTANPLGGVTVEIPTLRPVDAEEL
jgi:hypothetical protein